MNKPRVKHFIIFCSIILVILASITVFVLENDRKFDDFYLNIYEVDNNINSGYLIPAGEQLSGMFNDIYNSKTALIFLKRAEIIASATEDYSNFADYSERIYNKYDSNVEIAAVCAYALRMDWKHEKALSISEAKLKKSVYKNIYLLNIIDNNQNIDDLKIIDSFKDDYGFLFAGNYKPEMLAAAAEKNWDERYLIDQALLLLKTGEIKTAKNILLRTENESFSELKMFALFDNLDFGSAEEYFHQLQSAENRLDEQILFTGCDILMKNGKNKEASDLYKAYIEAEPDAYSLPYRNLYSLNRKSASAVNWLSTGLSFFPESSQLLIPAAWIMYLNNDYEELKNTITELEPSDDTVAELFKVNMMLAGRSPEHVIGNFWNVFNSDPESEAVAISFANYLLQNRQYDQLALLIRKYQRVNRPEEWVYQYSAIGRAMNGVSDQALKDIDTAIGISENYRNSFNKAVILELSGNTKGAIEYYQKALQKADLEEEINSDNLSKIYFKLAETNYNENSFRDAYHFIRMAIDLDPDNMKNKLLLRKIKEEHYD